MPYLRPLIARFKETALEEKLLWLYTALIPFLNIFYLKFHNKKIVCADIVFILLFLVCSVKYIKGKMMIGRNSIYAPLALMPVLFLPSFINSVSMRDSLVEFSGLMYLIILFILASNIVSSVGKLYSVLYVYIYSSVLLSLMGLYAIFTAFASGDMHASPLLGYGAMEAMAHHFPRLALTFVSPNMTLTYLHVALIMGLILFFTQNERRKRTIIFIATSIIFSAAFFTGSRRFAGLLLSVFLIFHWCGKGTIMNVIKYASLFAFLLVFIAAFMTSIWVMFPVRIIKNEVSKAVNIEVNYAYSIHYLLPAVSLNMFKKHPFIGIGFGTFNRNFKDNVDWNWLESSFGFEPYPGYPALIRNRSLNFDPHSVIFGVLAETGLCGLFGLFYFFVRYAQILAQRFKDAAHLSSERITFGCLLAGLAGFLLNAITLDILSMRHFWLMLAIGAAGIYLKKSHVTNNINLLCRENKKKT